MAVADVFTAITEDRPYRPGMCRDDSMRVLNQLAAAGALDGHIVSLLQRDYDVFLALRTNQDAGVAKTLPVRCRQITEAPSIS